MSTRRLLIATSTTDAWAAEEQRTITGINWLNVWASCVTATDLVGIFVGKTEVRPASICNIHAAALSLINISDDGIVFNALVREGGGDIRVPVTVTTSAIVEISVEPVV